MGFRYEDDGKVQTEFEEDDIQEVQAVKRARPAPGAYVELGRQMDMEDAGLVDKDGNLLDRHGNPVVSSKRPKKLRKSGEALRPKPKPIPAMSQEQRAELTEARLLIKDWVLMDNEQRDLILARKKAITKLLPCGRLYSGQAKQMFESFIQKLGGSVFVRKNSENVDCFEIRVPESEVMKIKNAKNVASGNPAVNLSSSSAADGQEVANLRAELEQDDPPISEEKALEVLEKLQKLPMTMAVLQSSKIGVAVTKCFKNFLQNFGDESQFWILVSR